MKNTEKLPLAMQRRQAIKKGASLLALALLPAGASAIGPANRVSDRTRRNIRKRHSVVAYGRANARQIAAAKQEAIKLQAKAYKKWEKTQKGRAYTKANTTTKPGSSGGAFKKPTTVVKAAPMNVVVRDLNVAPVQGVKVPPAAQGSRVGVMPVDIRTGGVVGNGVVEMAAAPGRGKSVSEQVRAANADNTINGGGVFLNTDIKLASL